MSAGSAALGSLKEVFPSVPEDRLSEVYQRHKTENYVDPLSSTIDYFLSNPQDKQNDARLANTPPNSTGTPVAVVDLSGCNDWSDDNDDLHVVNQDPNDVVIQVTPPQHAGVTRGGLALVPQQHDGVARGGPALMPQQHDGVARGGPALMPQQHDGVARGGPALMPQQHDGVARGGPALMPQQHDGVACGGPALMPQQHDGVASGGAALMPQGQPLLYKHARAPEPPAVSGIMDMLHNAVSAASEHGRRDHFVPPSGANTINPLDFLQAPIPDSLEPTRAQAVSTPSGNIYQSDQGANPDDFGELPRQNHMPLFPIHQPEQGAYPNDLGELPRSLEDLLFGGPLGNAGPVHPQPVHVAIAEPAPANHNLHALPQFIPTSAATHATVGATDNAPVTLDLSTVSTARSLSNDGLVEVSATGDAGGVREQPVAQPELKFSVHEVKQHVISMFPEIDEEYLENLIKAQPNNKNVDRVTQVCNVLLENPGFPKKKVAVRTPVESVSSLKRKYLSGDSSPPYNISNAVHRLLLFDFPQVAAVDIRNLCGKHKSRYSVVRQIIEKSLKKKATVNFSEQLLLGEKLKDATASLATLTTGKAASPGATAKSSVPDAQLMESLTAVIPTIVTAPAANQQKYLYDRYKRDCAKQIRAIVKASHRYLPPASVNRVAGRLADLARDGLLDGGPPAQSATTPTAKSANNGIDSDEPPLCLLKCPRKLARPSNLPDSLVREADFYETHLKIDYQEPNTSQAVANGGTDDEENLIECGCCYSEVAFEQLVQCSEGHLFCEDCLRAYVKEAVYGQGRSVLTCMTDGCDSKFLKNQLEKALPEEVLEKYEERVQEESIAMAQMQGLVACPFCDFKALMAPDDKVFVCANEYCLKKSCRYCKENWNDHFGIPCNEIEKKDETKIRTVVEEMMTKAKVRTCSKCSTEFFKEDGCNKMTCRCGQKMCYVCRKEKIDYNHFCQHVRNPGQGCTVCTSCNLWSNAKEDDAMAVEEVREEYMKRHVDETGEELEKLIGPPPDEPPRKKVKIR